MVKASIIADDDDTLFFVAAVLREAGAEVMVARTGVEGIDQVLDGDTTLVIVDVLLPDMEGLEVGRRLRAFATRSLHLVALTAAGGRETHDEVSRAGFDELLPRPLDAASLNRVLARARG